MCPPTPTPAPPPWPPHCSLLFSFTRLDHGGHTAQASSLLPGPTHCLDSVQSPDFKCHRHAKDSPVSPCSLRLSVSNPAPYMGISNTAHPGLLTPTSPYRTPSTSPAQ